MIQLKIIDDEGREHYVSDRHFNIVKGPNHDTVILDSVIMDRLEEEVDGFDKYNWIDELHIIFSDKVIDHFCTGVCTKRRVVAHPGVHIERMGLDGSQYLEEVIPPDDVISLSCPPTAEIVGVEELIDNGTDILT